MAQTRLEKIGTVYTRVISLLRGKAIKEEDKPLWLNVYEAFPPKYEPKFDRKLPKKPITPIFYEEDIMRAMFHKEQNFLPATNLAKDNIKSATQKFLFMYKTIKEQEKLSSEDAYKQTMQQYMTELEERKESRQVENELFYKS